MTKKIIRLLIGLLVIAIIVYAVATREGYSYDPNDGSETEAVADLIQENKRIEDDYEKSLEGKYEMEEKDTTVTDEGDIVIFYVTTDTIKRAKK
jgi:hypothetical protein